MPFGAAGRIVALHDVTDKHRSRRAHISGEDEDGAVESPALDALIRERRRWEGEGEYNCCDDAFHGAAPFLSELGAISMRR